METRSGDARYQGLGAPKAEVVTTTKEFLPGCNEAKCAQDEHDDLEEHGYHLLSEPIIHPASLGRRARTGTSGPTGTRSGLRTIEAPA